MVKLCLAKCLLLFSSSSWCDFVMTSLFYWLLGLFAVTNVVLVIPDLGHWLTHSLTHCHFRILTQRVTFETWDPFRHLIRVMSRQKEKKTKRQKRQKGQNTKRKKAKKGKNITDLDQKECLILWRQGSLELLRCSGWLLIQKSDGQTRGTAFRCFICLDIELNDMSVKISHIFSCWAKTWNILLSLPGKGR